MTGSQLYLRTGAGRAVQLLLPHEWWGEGGESLSLETRALVVRSGTRAKKGPCNALGLRRRMSRTPRRPVQSPKKTIPDGLLLNRSIACGCSCFLILPTTPLKCSCSWISAGKGSYESWPRPYMWTKGWFKICLRKLKTSG